MTVRLFSLLLLAVLFVAGCGVDKDEQVSANYSLIDQLPVFPGAREVKRESSSYEYEEDLFDGADGYSTTATFRVPPGTMASNVAEFYAAVPLPAGWNRELGAHVFFCVDDAELAVVVTSVEEIGLPVYYISADSQAADNPRRPLRC